MMTTITMATGRIQGHRRVMAMWDLVILPLFQAQSHLHNLLVRRSVKSKKKEA